MALSYYSVLFNERIKPYSSHRRTQMSRVYVLFNRHQHTKKPENNAIKDILVISIAKVGYQISLP